MSEAKLKDADKLYKKADKMTKLTFTRWSADWLEATPLFEQAATSYKLAKQWEKAKDCYDKAATGHEKQGTQWTAAQRLENAAQMSKESGKWDDVVDCYKRASALYIEAGRAGPAAEALFKGARAVEDQLPDEAVAMFNESCSLQEEEGKEANANECFRAAVNLFIKLKRYQEAGELLIRWGAAADKTKALQTQNKAYVSAVIVFLLAQDLKSADQTLDDVSSIDSFYSSEQGQLAEKLVSAYKAADAEEVKYIIKTSTTLNHLDHMIVRLAKQLPVGDLGAMAGTVGRRSKAGHGDDDDKPLDENDLL